MHLTEILRDLKGFFFKRIQSNNPDAIAKVVLDDLPRVIGDQNFKYAYEKLVYLAVGDIYQHMASSKCDSNKEEYQALLTQAESWIAKAGILKHPSGFDDNGILTCACKSLLYYTSGNKDMALDLCSQESERIFAEAQCLHDLCHWSCAVVIATYEAKKFSQVDPSIAGLLSVNDLYVSPISIILYVAIKCCKDESPRTDFYKHFEQLQQWLPPKITDHEKELHRSHMLLKNILL